MVLRALVADDNVEVTAALLDSLRSDPHVDVVATAVSGAETVALARATSPDVVIVDLDMSGGGTALVRELTQLHPAPRVLVFSGRDEPEAVLAVLRAGAAGFVAKGSVEGDFAHLLRRCAAGEVLINAGCGDVVATRFYAE